MSFYYRGVGWQGKMLHSEGYNYEQINIGQSFYGVWDLSGGKSFQSLWKTFYKFINFQAVIFVVKADQNSSNTCKDIAKSRKLIHEINLLEEFKNKLLILIVNIPQQDSQNTLRNRQQIEENKTYQKEQFFMTLQLIKWSEINNPHKLAFYLDANGQAYDYEQIWMAIDKKYNDMYKD